MFDFICCVVCCEATQLFLSEKNLMDGVLKSNPAKLTRRKIFVSLKCIF